MTTESANEFIRVRDAQWNEENPTEIGFIWVRWRPHSAEGNDPTKVHESIAYWDGRDYCMVQEASEPERIVNYTFDYIGEVTGWQPAKPHSTLPEEHLAALAELERVKTEARRIQGLCTNWLAGISAVERRASLLGGFVATVKVAMDCILGDEIRERVESEVGE